MTSAPTTSAPTTSAYDTVRYHSLQGRSVLIAGGISGLGAELVVACAAQGAKVAFLDGEAASGRALATRSGAHFIVCDMSDIEAVRAAVAEVEIAHEGIHVLISSAGRQGSRALAAIEPRDWHRHLAVSLDLPLFATQSVAAGMARRGGGSIVMLSPAPAFHTARAALRGLMRSLARELGPSGIRVNCILPGVLPTDSDTERVNSQVFPVPLSTSQVARMALFLASDESAGCTGAEFVVDPALAQD